MSSPTSRALNTPSIINRIIRALLIATTCHSSEPSSFAPNGYRTLRITCLVQRSWLDPSRRQLYAILHFSQGNEQLQKWLEVTKQTKYSTSSLRFIDPLPFREGKGCKWRYKTIRRVIKRVQGVKEIVLDLQGQETLPVEWLISKNLKGVVSLTLASPLSSRESSLTPPFDLRKLIITDNYPQLERDWSSTITFLTQRSLIGSQHLERLELHLDPVTYTKHLVPILPLPSSRFEGTLFPFAASLRHLTLPSLLPTETIHNLAIFASACNSLVSLEIKLVTPLSSLFSTLTLLRFFTTIEMLTLNQLEGLPHANILHRTQLEQIGRGDVILSLLNLLTGSEGDGTKWLDRLKLLSIDRYKFVEPQQFEELGEVAREKRVVVVWGQELKPTKEEIKESIVMKRKSIWLHRREGVLTVSPASSTPPGSSLNFVDGMELFRGWEGSLDDLEED